jgi:parvulin-like peptidyl-prolyl isomerase
MSKDFKKSIPSSAKARRFISSRVTKKKVNKLSDDRLPRITNESVSKHREEVIRGAKKYIYPLKQSRHRVVMISVSILVGAFIIFSSFILLSLYKFNSTSDFAYQITKALPLPFARVGGTFVPYEEYLFELKHYIHYFEQQQEVDFSSDQGKRQLDDQRQRSRDVVIDNAYARKIAKEKGITITEQEVDQQIEYLKKQNRLGNDDQVFEDVLKDYYDWTLQDFRRSIKQELLNAKVVKALDASVKPKAEQALDEINAGSTFSDVAKKYSEDETTKANGGQLGFLISKNDRNIPPETINALSQMQPGDVSKIIDLGYELEILRLDGIEDDKFKASRIAFKYGQLEDYLNDLKAEQPASYYVSIKKIEPEAEPEPETPANPAPEQPAQ